LAAQQAGFTGAGVKIGIADGGSIPTNPALDGTGNSQKRNKVEWFYNYTPGAANPTQITETDSGGTTFGGHGDTMAQIIAGDAYTETLTGSDAGTYTFNGGVAPGASLYEAGICYADSSGSVLCHWSSQSANDLIGQGVKLINESFDSTDITTIGGASSADAVSINYIDQQVASAGVLQVIATGDDSTQKNAGEYAGMPYLFPSLQPDIIAATGIAIGSNGQPDPTTAVNATPCGVAAAWCLTAPVVVVTLPSPPAFATGQASGTSASAAMISGVAAQVAQAFPWMQAPQLSDTLLSTATPIDDGSHKTPNPTYGWGMVNADKAVHGPSQFLDPGVYGAFQAPVPAGMTSTFSNDITGPGGLLMNGQGTLVLSGGNTYAGTTEIASGTLQVDGAIASTTTVDAGGNLAGTGVVNANVANNGTVTSNATTAGHGLVIDGNLTDGASSTTAVGLGNPLQVKGTAAVAGTMNVLGAPSGYTVKSTENLLTGGSVSGTFASLTFASGVFYTGTLGYTPTQVNVTLTQVAPQAAAAVMPGSTSQTLTSASNVGSALAVSNQWVTSGNTAGHGAWLQDAGKFLSAPEAANAVASLNSLSGEIYATGRVVETEQALAADASLANRAGALGADSRPGVWVQALGADGTLARTGYDAATYRAGGVMAGADMSFGNGLSAGIAAGRTHSDADMQALGGTIDARQNLVGVYARWDAGNGWYANGRVTFSHISNGVNRTVLLGTSLTGLMGGHNDHLTLATLEGGKSIDLGVGTLTPYVAATDLRLHQSGFSESGSAMGLLAPSQTHNATTGTVGVRYGTAFLKSDLEGYASFRRVFSGDDFGMVAGFNGVPGTLFMAEGQSLPRNLGTLGARLTTHVTQSLSWFIDADYQRGSESAHQAEADIGLRFAF
jgi:autotransporter-associated beta strand protein